MILADSSIWIDHFRIANLQFSRLLDTDKVLMHPFVLGELAMGSIRNRAMTIADLRTYEFAPLASADEVLVLIESASLFSRGIGYIDTHLLAACLIHGDCALLTRDGRLQKAAEQLGIAA